MTEFTGEVHPLADAYPYLPDDDMQALADHIGENGLQIPLVLDASGRLVAGRNRLRACGIAGVEPVFDRRPDLDTDSKVAAFIQGENDERLHRTAGQVAMSRALNLQAQGKRKNGRWERGSTESRNNTEQDNMRKSGLILDVADRAAALGPDFADYPTLPAQVMGGEIRLDFAYRLAQDFDGKAAMAEAMKTQPLTEALLRLAVILDDLESLYPLPALEVPLTKEHREQIKQLCQRLRQIATDTSTYAKESK